MIMFNMWKKFSVWAKLAEWKSVIGKIRNFFKGILYRIYKLFKYIWIYIVKFAKCIWKFLGWIFIPVAVLALIILLSVAFINFININDQVRTIFEDCATAIKKAEMPLMINENLHKMESLKRNVFDSNTITFMASFILVFLGGILLGIESRAKKIIDKTQKTKDRFEAEQNTMSLNSQILMLQVFSMNCQNALDINRDDSIMFLNYRTYNIATKILKEIKDRDNYYITKERKKTIDDIFITIINDFGMEEDQLEVLTSTSVRITYKDSILQTVGVLKELQTEISKLKTV